MNLNFLDMALLEAKTASDTLDLLAAGANPNCQDEHGVAPLHEARDAEQTRALLDVGASPDVTDGAGDLPIHFVRSVAQARALLAAGSRVPDDLEAVERGLVQQAEREQLQWLMDHELQPRAGRLTATAPAARPRRRA